MKAYALCISDRCSKGECEDISGRVLCELLSTLCDSEYMGVVPDEKDIIAKRLCELSDGTNPPDFIFTTGGTGFAPRDVTPEATLSVIERNAPGISEAIRAESLKITPKAMLSRGVSGIRGKTLIINLPGSPKAVREAFEIVAPVLSHAAETLSGNTQSCGGSYNK